MRADGRRKETIYAIGCLLAAVMLLGTAGGMETNMISLATGVWQMIWSLVLGLWCCNGIRLEETRAVRRGRMN